MTLIELLAVSAVLLMMAGAMTALAINVQDSGRHTFEQALSLQHGLVVLQRIQRAVSGATANAEFPGFLVLAAKVHGQPYPDTLVVWYAPGGVADPDGLPRMNELVVFCPNPENPEELWELTVPDDTRTAPAADDLNDWEDEVDDMQTSNSAVRVVLTDLLRVANAAPGQKQRRWRAAVRFESDQRPSTAEWSAYLQGTRSWDSLSWAQGIHGTRTGLRQSRCRYELQLRPGDTADNSRDAAIPLFGSGAVFYELQQP